MTEIYCARWVVPVATPSLIDGAVAVDGTRLAAVGPLAEVEAQFPGATVHDFKEAAILPGFINAHSHLELTVMRGWLDSVENDFFRWLRKLTAARNERLSAGDLYASAAAGAIEAARAGVTCMGDASFTGVPSFRALLDVGLRGIVYQECIGPDAREAGMHIVALDRSIKALRGLETDRVRAGVSPHAPYTLSVPLLDKVVEYALLEGLPVMMHAAESEAEHLLVREASGPFAESLARRGIEWRSPRTSTIQYLAKRRVLETRPLLAHCIRVDAADIATLKGFDARIAHCPKSNAKLGHGRAPFAAFLSCDLKVGLGTDSVGSNNICDMLDEARFATLLSRSAGALIDPTSSHNAEPRPDGIEDPETGGGHMISPEEALFAATLGGARALGMDNETGALVKGFQADITIVDLSSLHQQPVNDPAAALLFSSSGRDVRLTMVAGREVYRDGCMLTIDEAGVRRRLLDGAARLG